MTKSRLYSAQNPQEQFQKAFKTGVFSPEVIGYLTTSDLRHRMRLLPKDTSYICLSPEILALDANKLADLLEYLPEHVKTVNFNFRSLDQAQLPQFQSLMSLVYMAVHASVFNMEWDFNRFPMAELQRQLDSGCMPGNLAYFNFTINSPGSQNVSQDDLTAFRRQYCFTDTKVFKDIRYSAIEDHGQHKAYDFARIGR